MTVRLNNQQMSVARRILNGAGYGMTSVTDIMGQSANFKHDIGCDFGYPKTEELSFHYFYQMWRRHGIARALVEKTTGKTWQDLPKLKESSEGASEETVVEREIRQHFEAIRFWQQLQEADMRSMVGKYAGVIFQLGDGKPYNEPVKSVPGGVEGVISVIPAWEGQLEPSTWDGDPTSPTYGQPQQFRFNESSVDPEEGKVRSFTVHPDRCFVWSRDGTTFGDSKLEPCYNALIDLEKIRGAGGEGFWKNAKAQPVLQASTDVDFTQLASMLGVELDGLADALDEVMGKWSKGFDDSLVLQGMEAKTLPVSLPDPEEFFNIAIQEVAASWPIPQKTLVGMQTGERASTEDSREWAQTNMSRRANLVVPNIMTIIGRLESWGVLPERDWHLEWPDLTAPTLGEKLEIGERMAKINQAMFATGEAVFTDDEIREVAGYAQMNPEQPSELEDGEDVGA
jgi:hypothetical protein